ncbi:MAG: zf-HC2 domain-containing protein [Lachnospiraceae bacterium]|nr:zf-HC2 domain-containing protein [Lachnospiraceae bacterium]
MKKHADQKRIKPLIPKDCREVQKLNGEFIGGNLPFETAYAFTKHVRGCTECMEELNAYYMFYTAVRYLNEKDAGDMPQNVESMLKDVESEALYEKNRKRNIWIAITAFSAALIIFAILLINENIF